MAARSENPKSQLEKRVDALELLITSLILGVGENVGNHNERFNDYSGNTITGGDYNDTKGQSNSITNSYDTSAGGYGNQITGSRDTLCFGNQNILFNVMYSALFGNNNRFQGVQHSIIAGAGNKDYETGESAGTIDRSAVFGDENSIFARIAYSLVTGSQNTIRGEVLSSVIASYLSTIYNATNAIVGGEYASMPANNRLRLVVGNGYRGSPQNCFTVDSAGDVTARAYNTFGADYAEYFEWLDGNPSGEDRRGLLVTFNGDKLVPAHGDSFIGAVSACPSVVGNAYENYWHGKYKTDVFGAVLLDKNGKPIISEDFDQSRVYVPRSKRPEWSPVGLIGKLIITDDGSCTVGGFVSARDGRATKCYANTGARVIRRIDDKHVEILLIRR